MTETQSMMPPPPVTTAAGGAPMNSDGQQPVKLLIGIPKEIHAGERRVATTPDTARKLQKLGFSVLIERGAGESADFPDARYIEADCRIANDSKELWSNANIILKVRAPENNPAR